MDEITPGPHLRGQKVQVPGKPDWGVGTVLKVQETTANGAPLCRITIQFPHGTRTLQSPPARLAPPQAEIERKQGWLDSIGGRTIDERLKQLPDDVIRVLGTPLQRLAVVLKTYAYTDDPKSLIRWARAQTGLADPLSQWSRDELSIAFGVYCNERDAHLRNLAALVIQTEGRPSLDELLAKIDDDAARAAVSAALRRPI